MVQFYLTVYNQLFNSVRYLCEHSKRTNKKIENKYKFFEVSLDKNLNPDKSYVTESFDEMIERLTRNE